MSIFTFILGFIIGFFIKLGMDFYHEFKKEQEKTAIQMEDVLTRFKAMEMVKEEKENI